jgi:hypothetical protein
MTSDAHAVQFDERRKAPRVNIGGRYTMRLDPCDGRDVITCAVMDYSVTGARLEMPQDIELPSELQVIIGALSHRVRIAWRAGRVVGIDFVDEHYSLY